MKRKFLIVVVPLLIAFLVSGCNLSKQVRVSFDLTDAPIDAAGVSAVAMTVSAVSVHANASAGTGDQGWSTVVLNPAKTINVLALQGGLVEALGEIDMPAGTTITQVRLGVDEVAITKSDTVYPATIPGGTEFKLVGAFKVPLSGGVTITVDFDARKSIVETGANTFRIMPTIRAVINDEAGSITGTATAGHVVYAYADGAWSDSEPTADANGITYANAYTSTSVGDAGTYKLAFLAPGVYDLYLVDPASGLVSATKANVSVVAGSVTQNTVF